MRISMSNEDCWLRQRQCNVQLACRHVHVLYHVIRFAFWSQKVQWATRPCALASQRRHVCTQAHVPSAFLYPPVILYHNNKLR